MPQKTVVLVPVSEQYYLLFERHDMNKANPSFCTAHAKEAVSNLRIDIFLTLY